MREVPQDTGETVMAKLLIRYLFKWQDVEAKSDLERLELVLEHLPDERLMETLEKYRKWGRDDYPIRPVWNSVLAGVVYQHESVESLRTELLRNGELREGCGFDPHKGSEAVPPSWVYTRFLKLLFKFKAEIDAMFDCLVDALRELLPRVFCCSGFEGGWTRRGGRAGRRGEMAVGRWMPIGGRRRITVKGEMERCGRRW
jgi:Transposase domain (DUF772)